MSKLFEELYIYFKETYFTPDLSAIENFETYDIQRFLPYLVVGLCAGVFIAACITYYCQDYLGRAVRRLYKANAFDENCAKTLDEIECNKFLIRRNLYKDTVLSKYVKATTEINSGKDACTARFYLKEEDKYIADKRFKKMRGGKLSLVLVFFLCLIGCFGLLFLIPQILQLADNVINLSKG